MVRKWSQYAPIMIREFRVHAQDTRINPNLSRVAKMVVQTETETETET